MGVKLKKWTLNIHQGQEIIINELFICKVNQETHQGGTCSGDKKEKKTS
jgi:hypothetical protein